MLAGLASIFAVLGWKMVFYTVVLAGVFVRLGVWKKRCITAQDALKAKNFELEQAQQQLVEMGAQTIAWKAKATEQVEKVVAAQSEAQQVRTEYESKAQAILQSPVADKDAVQFLRDEASK